MVLHPRLGAGRSSSSVPLWHSPERFGLLSESVAGRTTRDPPLALRTLAEVRHVVEIFEEVLLLLGERAALSGGSEGGRLGGELCVEVADVFFSHDGRDEWRCDFPMEKSVPIRVLKRNSPLDRSGNTFVRQLQRSHPEKRLLLHVLCVLLPGAQTPLRVPPQQLDSRNKTASRISSFRNRQTTGAGSDV